MKRNLFLFLLFLCPIGVFSQNIEVAGEIIADSINVNSGIIRNVANPILATDAATKSYVDLQILEEQLNTGIRVQDIDNNIYKTVRIGSQVWMSENLKTTRYNDGTAIPLIADSTAWATASTSGAAAFTWYGNDTANLITYGALYNGYAIDAIDTSSNGSKNVCPTGWHVPTDVEWTTLTDYLGGSPAGGKLKEAGEAHWDSSNTGATNESGFAGLPGGTSDANGTISSIGNGGYWWSSTEYDSTNAWNRVLYYFNGNVYRYSFSKGNGMSVRCLRDASALLTKLDSAGVADLGYVAGTKTLTEILTESADAGNKKITNLGYPTDSTDAATKSYVDALEGHVSLLIKNILLDAGYNGTLSDVEGNLYKTIKIGGQVWMSENLRTTKYNDGEAIPLIADSTAWATASSGAPAFTWYNNDTANLITYGALYNGFAIETVSNEGKNVCPTGWHVPTDVEWDVLRDFLDPSSDENNNTAGGKMKEAGLAHWNSPNTKATNESGFAGLPGGYRSTYGSFLNIGVNGYWWSSTESSTAYAWYRFLIYISDDVQVQQQ